MDKYIEEADVTIEMYQSGYLKVEQINTVSRGKYHSIQEARRGQENQDRVQ